MRIRQDTLALLRSILETSRNDIGLPQDVCDRAYLCGLVHDIGKVGLPPSLLGKEGPLTLEERREMQDHSEIGERILREVDGVRRCRDGLFAIIMSASTARVTRTALTARAFRSCLGSLQWRTLTTR